MRKLVEIGSSFDFIEISIELCSLRVSASSNRFIFFGFAQFSIHFLDFLWLFFGFQTFLRRICCFSVIFWTISPFSTISSFSSQTFNYFVVFQSNFQLFWRFWTFSDHFCIELMNLSAFLFTVFYHPLDFLSKIPRFSHNYQIALQCVVRPDINTWAALKHM